MCSPYRLTIACLLVAVASYGYPQSGPWTSSAESAASLAARIDKSMVHLPPVEGGYQLNLSYRGTGSQDGTVKVVQPLKQLNLEFAEMHYPSNKKDSPLGKGFLISDGKLVRLEGSTIPKKVTPYGKTTIFRAKKPSDWVFGLSRSITSGILGENPFSKLVASIGATKGGYSLKVCKRLVVSEGHQFNQTLLTVTRSRQAVARYGAFRLDIVFDDLHNLPVTASASMKEPDQSPVVVRWTMEWLPRRSVFPPETFKVYK
jgi:hypothetical protein